MVNPKDLKHLEKEFLSHKIPYAIDEERYTRYPEHMNIFKRVAHDKNYKNYNRPISEREEKKVGKKGYSRVGYAARIASWTVYDYFDDALNWDSVSHRESTPTEASSNLPKYESTDLKLNAKHVKRTAQIFGATHVGITKLDKKFIYSHDYKGEPIEFPEGVKYAVVMLIEMDYAAIGTSPQLPASISTGRAYSDIKSLIAMMAEFFRNLGYTAIPAGNGVGLSIPLAIQAGLGQLGRNGLLITPKGGQVVRICKVFTDFPMETDKPIDFGVTEFCKVCKKCAKFCPSQSISHGDMTWETTNGSDANNNGTLKWYINPDTCYEYWLKNTSDCSNCIRVCPFSKPPGRAHDVARFFIKNFRFLDWFMVKLDDLMGMFPFWAYGKKKSAEKFWKSNKYRNKKLHK